MLVVKPTEWMSSTRKGDERSKHATEHWLQTKEMSKTAQHEFARYARTQLREKTRMQHILILSRSKTAATINLMMDTAS